MRSWVSGFAGSVAVIACSAYIAISISALLGLSASPSVARIALVVAVAIAAILLHKPEGRLWRLGAWVGIAVGLVGILGLELVGGNPSVGAGQLGALLGAVLVFPALGLTPPEVAPSVARVGLVILMALVAVALVRSVLDGGALGHDESAYALKTRAWVAGTTDSGWQLHRAPLNSLLAVPIIAFTESEVALRLLGSILALASLGAVTLIAHEIGGWWAAVMAAGAVGASVSYLRRGSEFLTDVPAAGLLLLVVWLVLSAVRDPNRRGRSLVWVGPLVLAAFYMRYQSSLVVAGVTLGVLLIFPDPLKKAKKWVVLAGGIVIAGLLPHLVWATVVTGKPWGIVLLTGDAGGRAFLGEGLVDYARMFPIHLAGPIGAILMAIGIPLTLWRAVRYLKGSRELVDAIAVFLFVVLAVAVIPLGLLVHGEPRFVFFPAWLLIAYGASGLVEFSRRIPQPLLTVLISVAAIVWLPVFTETARFVDRNAESRGEAFSVLVEASDIVANDGPGECAVLTTYRPQVGWYTRCETEQLRVRDGSLGIELLDADREYLLLFENGKRQPTDDELEEFVDLEAGVTIPAVNDRLGDATIIDVTVP